MTVQQTIRVPDMMCAACAAKIEAEVGKLAGVAKVQANPTTKLVVVEGEVKAAAVADAIRTAGFKPDV